VLEFRAKGVLPEALCNHLLSFGWGLGDLELVKLALKFQPSGNAVTAEAMRTDWLVGPCPPGYHLPGWERKENENFEPIRLTGSGPE